MAKGATTTDQSRVAVNQRVAKMRRIADRALDTMVSWKLGEAIERDVAQALGDEDEHHRKLFCAGVWAQLLIRSAAFCKVKVLEYTQEAGDLVARGMEKQPRK